MKINFNKKIYKHEEPCTSEWERQLNTAETIIAQFNKKYKTMILADEVGMGKTYSALAVMAQFVSKGQKVLLIVPTGGILEKKWIEEITYFNKKYFNGQFTPIIAQDLNEAVSFLNVQNENITRFRNERKQYFTSCLKKWIKNEKLSSNPEYKINTAIKNHSELKERFYSIYPYKIVYNFFSKIFYDNQKLKKITLKKRIAEINEGNFDFLKKFSSNIKKYSPNIIIVTMNSRKFETELKDSHFSLVVIDEAHNWKNGKRGANDFKSLADPHIEYKLLLSATPVQLHPDELQKIFDNTHSKNCINLSLQTVDQLQTTIDNCTKHSKFFLEEWKKLTPDQSQLLKNYFTTPLSVTEILTKITESELQGFVKKLQEYHTYLKQYENTIKKIIIRHKKSKETRSFHCGSGYNTHNQTRQNYLYETMGYCDDNNLLLSFIGMRARQLIARQHSQQESVCLLGGINSSYEAYQNHLENKKITTNDPYMEFFLRQIKNTEHPKIMATITRAYSNLLSGKKTLIFCERKATQAIIKQKLADLIKQTSKATNSLQKTNWLNNYLENDITEIINKMTDEDEKQELSVQCTTIINKINEISNCLRALNPALKTHNSRELYEKLKKIIEIDQIDQPDTKSYHIWHAIATSQNQLVDIIHGETKYVTRVNRCAGFNSPLAPYILICTAIGSEGINLHQFCDDIIIHDLPWNPAKLEQKIGRIDRINCLASQEGSSNNIGIPFLADDYDELQYKTLLARAQMQEILFGDFIKSKSANQNNHDETDGNGKVIEPDINSEADFEEQETVPLPQKLIEFLTLDLSVMLPLSK